MDKEALKKLIRESFIESFKEEFDIEEIPLDQVDMSPEDKVVFDTEERDDVWSYQFGDDKGFSSNINEMDMEDDIEYVEGMEDWDSLSPEEQQTILADLEREFELSLNETKNLALDELNEIIKEGVEKLHRKNLIENRLEQINQELNALSNPESWEDAHKEAQAQLRKKTIAFNNMIPIEKLMSESNNIEEEAPSTGLTKKQKSDVVKKAKAGKDIGKKGKGFKDVEAAAKKSGADDPKAVAAATMWKNIQRESINDIMGRAAKLMAEAKEEYKKISKKD